MKKIKSGKNLFPSKSQNNCNSNISVSKEADLDRTNLNASNIITGIWDSIEEEMNAA